MIFLQTVYFDNVDRRSGRAQASTMLSSPFSTEFLDTIKDNIHTRVVADYMRGRGHVPIIGRQPPPIHPSESRLSQPYRAALAQLRDGHSIHLHGFAHRIGQAPSSTCPRCDIDAEDVAHLFDCPAAPTTLSAIDLWLNPIQVAQFLARHPSFSDLPPPLPPPLLLNHLLCLLSFLLWIFRPLSLSLCSLCLPTGNPDGYNNNNNGILGAFNKITDRKLIVLLSPASHFYALWKNGKCAEKWKSLKSTPFS